MNFLKQINEYIGYEFIANTVISTLSKKEYFTDTQHESWNLKDLNFKENSITIESSNKHELTIHIINIHKHLIYVDVFPTNNKHNNYKWIVCCYSDIVYDDLENELEILLNLARILSATNRIEHYPDMDKIREIKREVVNMAEYYEDIFKAKVDAKYIITPTKGQRLTMIRDIIKVLEYENEQHGSHSVLDTALGLFVR